MGEIKQTLAENKYMLEQEVRAEELEIESLDILIRRLENRQN